MTSEQREVLYKQWGIAISAKQRKVRLANMVWTDPHDEEHIKMSADLVARVVGLWDRSSHGSRSSKEIFQLSPSSNIEKPWFGPWSSITSLFSYSKR
jgi:centromeric protein E